MVKHVVSYIPASGLISGVGVVSEGKNQLISKGEIPLMITPMGRKQFNQSIKTQEMLSKLGGLFCIWLSFSLGLLSLNGHFSLIKTGEDWQIPFAISSLVALIPFATIYYYFTYNSLVGLRTKVINSWANVDVELKNRRDLVPNLISSLEAYLEYEKSSFQVLTDCREKLNNERRLSERIKIENEITKNISKISASIEKNPNLKGDGPVILLNQKITTIENKIAHAKGHFNAVVEEYNNLVCGFPSKWVAQFNYFSEVPQYDGEAGKKLDALGKREKPKIATDRRKPPELNSSSTVHKNIEPNKVSKKTA